MGDLRLNATFAGLIERLSEPTNAPHGDNLVSNEDSYPRVAGEVARRAPRDAVYVGVGPDQNFTLIAHARPAFAFVADFRRRNLLLQLIHKALMTLARDRVAYLSRLTAREPGPLPETPTGADLARAFAAAEFSRTRLEQAVAEVAEHTGPLNVLREGEREAMATIQARLAGPGTNARFLALPMYPTFGRMMAAADRDGKPAHFLASENLYQTVRALQVSDGVVPIVADFGGPKSFAALGDWLREKGRRIGVLYASDVEFFLLRAGKFPAYLANLGQLPWAPGAIVVRTSTREIEHPDRFPGDSATTTVSDAAAFLADARAGRIKGPDDLFRH